MSRQEDNLEEVDNDYDNHDKVADNDDNYDEADENDDNYDEADDNDDNNDDIVSQGMPVWAVLITGVVLLFRAPQELNALIEKVFQVILLLHLLILHRLLLLLLPHLLAPDPVLQASPTLPLMPMGVPHPGMGD